MGGRSLAGRLPRCPRAGDRGDCGAGRSPSWSPRRRSERGWLGRAAQAGAVGLKKTCGNSGSPRLPTRQVDPAGVRIAGEVCASALFDGSFCGDRRPFGGGGTRTERPNLPRTRRGSGKMAQHQKYPASPDRPGFDLSDAEVDQYFRDREEWQREDREAEEASGADHGLKDRRVRITARHRRAPRASGCRRRGSRRGVAQSGRSPDDPDGEPKPGGYTRREVGAT